MTLKNIDPGKITKENIHEIIREVWDNHMPFHRHINQKVIRFDSESAEIYIKSNDNIIIEDSIKHLHGGVIAALLDNTGALLSLTYFVEKHSKFNIEYIVEKSQKIATLDLNINFLRPGAGQEFFCRGKLLNGSKRLVLAAMELRNEKNDLIAMATGKYMISL
jgi:uncharacterized protein (TIGR00369 family)